jgi:ADP-L-glycero-D-manno-heptose 6-epimerase
MDVVLHQAALGSVPRSIKDPATTIGVNVFGFTNILHSAVENGVKRFVFASSSSVYGDEKSLPKVEEKTGTALSPYAISKQSNETIALNFAAIYGIEVIGLRYFNVYGPGEYYKGKMASMVYQLYKQMKEGKRPRVFKYGEQQRDFVYVKDIVKINLCALNNGKETGVYNAATGIARDYNTIINCLNKELGTNLEPEYIDNPYPFFQLKTQADMTLAKEKLGYEPDYSLEAGIADYVAILEGRNK